MENIRDTLGTNIRLYRQQKGLTQESLAEKLDVSSSYIGYVERGQKSPSLQLMERISEVLEVEPALLLSKSDDENDELKRLISLLAGKEPYSISYIHHVADAYFKSLREHDLNGRSS